jgi:hypothetical protein
MRDLQVGDVIRHKSGGMPVLVSGNYGSRVTVVQT